MAERSPDTLLGPYRVLDLADELGAFCGKLLGDLGADVVKIEPPGGDPSRRLGPFFRDQVHPELSLTWMALNVHKRGVTLDLTSATGQALFRRLVAASDFVVESFAPGHLEGLGLGWDMVRQISPRLILVSISPYGQTGPFAHRPASDLEIMASSGCMSLVGEPGRPPLRVSHPQSGLWTGLHAAAGALIAHYYRELTGVGQHVDTSAQATMMWATVHAPLFWDVNRELATRAGASLTGRSVTGANMRTIWECNDGYLTFTLYGGAAGKRTNIELTRWMASKGMATDFLLNVDWDAYDVTTLSQEEVDRLEEAIRPFFLTLTRQEFFHGALARDMLGYQVSTVEDILSDPQLEARAFWTKLSDPTLQTDLVFPGPFARFAEGQASISRPAPRIGEHNAEIYQQELGLSREELEQLAGAGVI